MNLNTSSLPTERFDSNLVSFIDLMRGIAAFMVLTTHAFDLSVGDAYGSPAESPDSWRLARAALGNGVFWVWFFFVISGMCIHQSIARSMETGTFRWKSYIIARITRIYPLFLLGLTLAVIAWWLGEDWAGDAPQKVWPQFFASLLNLQIFTTTFPAFQSSWSLSCEVVYYAMWPVLLLLFKRRTTQTAFIAITLSLLAILAIAIGRHYSAKMGTSAAIGGLFTTLVLFPVWVGGAWIGTHWRRYAAQITDRLWYTSILICFLADGLFVVLRYRMYHGWAEDMTAWVAAPGLLIFLAGSSRIKWAQSEQCKRLSEWLGRFSYPCYILHMQILLILHHFTLQWLPKSITGNPLLHFGFLFLPVLSLLAVAGPWLETRIMAWRSRLMIQLPR